MLSSSGDRNRKQSADLTFARGASCDRRLPLCLWDSPPYLTPSSLSANDSSYSPLLSASLLPRRTLVSLTFRIKAHFPCYSFLSHSLRFQTQPFRYDYAQTPGPHFMYFGFSILKAEHFLSTAVSFQDTIMFGAVGFAGVCDHSDVSFIASLVQTEDTSAFVQAFLHLLCLYLPVFNIKREDKSCNHEPWWCHYEAPKQEYNH